MIEQEEGYNSQFLRGCNTDWNINTEFIYWINYWFKEYRDKAGIDLSFHRFEYKGKEYTQKEIIDRVIEVTEEIIKDDDCFWDKDVAKKVDEVFDLFHLVFYAMWW